jgi:hypothetical protein
MLDIGKLMLSTFRASPKREEIESTKALFSLKHLIDPNRKGNEMKFRSVSSLVLIAQLNMTTSCSAPE